MTPLEIAYYMEGRITRLEHEHRERITAAWTAAALERTKRLPSLEQLLKKQEEGKRKGSGKEILEQLEKEMDRG